MLKARKVDRMTEQEIRDELHAILREAQSREELIGALAVLVGGALYERRPRPYRGLWSCWREWQRRLAR